MVLAVQLKEEEERIEESEAETRKKMKATKEHTKKWEETRENRVCILPVLEHCFPTACTW